MFRSVVTCAALFLAIGCSKSDTPPVKVTYVAKDDPKMSAAIDKARATAPTFIAALKAPKASQSGFSVKMGFKDGEQVEHMWLSPVRFDGTKFHGTVNNQPEKVTNVKLGQEVSIEPGQISDWMYIDNKKLVGGYTLRHLRDSMPANERAAFDKSIPFVIE